MSNLLDLSDYVLRAHARHMAGGGAQQGRVTADQANAYVKPPKGLRRTPEPTDVVCALAAQLPMMAQVDGALVVLVECREGLGPSGVDLRIQGKDPRWLDLLDCELKLMLSPN